MGVHDAIATGWAALSAHRSVRREARNAISIVSKPRLDRRADKAVTPA